MDSFKFLSAPRLSGLKGGKWRMNGLSAVNESGVLVNLLR